MRYVVGHKNPDSDSICSAIALAYFLDAFPARQGDRITSYNVCYTKLLRLFLTASPKLILTIFSSALNDSFS